MEKNIKSVIESILFAIGESITIEKLAQAIHESEEKILKAMNELIELYNEQDRGINIIKTSDTYQMCANKKNYDYIKNIYRIPNRAVLTDSLLEVLVIIAYKQPVTRNEIEDIRGVSVLKGINKLLEYGLIIEKGRLNTPGKPILFGTSNEFLKCFGLNSLKDMPPLEVNSKIIEEEAKQEVENSIKF